MSTASGINAVNHNFRPSDGPPVVASASGEVDPQLVQDTRNEIRELILEITQLSQQDISPADFFAGFLSRVVSALVAVGGAVWLRKDDGQLELAYRINLEAAELGDANVARHQFLLRRVLQSGQALAAPPHSGFPDDDMAGNPTDFLVLLVPILRDQQAIGLLEILQRPGAGPTTQRGYLRFLVQMSELAAGFLKNHRLKQYAEREIVWGKLDQFLTELHKSLSLRETSFALVNEARLLLECDRVSLVLKRGSTYELTAVSGLDSIDRRTEQATLLAQLASAVMSTGEPLWTSDHPQLPPQIEKPLHDYVDRSHAKAIAILPLQMADSEASQPTEILGALVIESMSDNRFTESLRARAKLVVHYATPGLAHAIEHEYVFLLSFWKWLGTWRQRLTATNAAKYGTLSALFVMMLLTLALLPWPFEVAARGKVQPTNRWEIFAPESGTIVSVPVRHGQTVQAGDLLAELANTEIDVQLTNLLGRQRIAQEQLQTNQRALLESGRGRPKLNSAEENRLSGELLQLKQTLAGIEQELQLVREKQKRLSIKADHTGEVVTWQVEQLLLRRPVQQGQALMSVVDPQGNWELELQLPERRLRHLDAANEKRNGQAIPVTFMLSTMPGVEYRGEVREIERAAQSTAEGNMVLLRVAFDKTQLPPLRSDTSVTAKLHCGQRSFGYVWFCDLLETMQTHVLFWL